MILIKDNYTPEEIIYILDLTSADLCDAFSEEINDRYDELIKQIQEDTGYAYDD
jgi:hypothetical protein